MQQLTNQERLRPWAGFVLAGVAVAALLFAFSCNEKQQQDDHQIAYIKIPGK